MSQNGALPVDAILKDNNTGEVFDPSRITKFTPFPRGKAIFGGFFGDEGKGKEVDITAAQYTKLGYKVLSIRGQGSGNAGHTVKVGGVKYDFHYLTSAGLSADIMLLGPGMLIDPIRVLLEAKKLPDEKRKIIFVAERATIVTDADRAMDEWCENARKNNHQSTIGTTKSGVGPGAGTRGFRFHVTFADALNCSDYTGLKDLFLNNPVYPDEVKAVLTNQYVKELWNAIHQLNIVDSVAVVNKYRKEGNWAVLLEVSQAVLLDPLFGNEGHFTTSTPCTNVGGIVGSGLTMHDFPDGSVMVLKSYGSKVGGGPYITKFSAEESHIDCFIDEMVGEHGVTTGRKRDLGWFDGPAVRYSLALTNADICVNCMDVIVALAKEIEKIKVCFAYKNIKTGKVTYDWPYFVSDYEPLFIELPIKGKSEKQIIKEYICLIEAVIGKEIQSYGTGPSREDYHLRKDAFKI